MKRDCLNLIPSSLCLVGYLFIPASAIAQMAEVTSDGTLATIVTSADGNNFTIDGGNRPNGGSNLFHSFQDFSVPTNGSAFFNNAPDIANIISRVTGGNISSIDGLIKANGNANLFLINPAGIIFGQNGRLDIGGSFFGSTAGSLLFPEGEFSAVDTQTPPLLTVNIPIGLRFRDNPGDIVNQSSANGVGLSVNEGKNIALIGGNVRVENGGIIFAPGGRVELGGLIATGTIGIADDGSLSFPDGIARGDVSVTDSAIVAVYYSGGGGSIDVNAKNFNLTNGSQFLGGIRENQGLVDAQAGDIVIDATETVSFAQEDRKDTGIFNSVEKNSTGNAGNINIITKNLSLTDGTMISAVTSGQGNTGDVNINAFETVSFDGQLSGIYTSVAETGVGNTGDIDITTKNLSLTNESQIFSVINGKGNIGKININVDDSIFLDGIEGNTPSRIASFVDKLGVGNSDEINLNTKNLLLTNGANIGSIVAGKGNTSDLTINASETISFDGEDPNSGRSKSGIFSAITAEGVGSLGNIKLTTSQLSITNGANITHVIGGRGNKGDVSILATESILLDGQGSKEGSFSGIYTLSLPGAIGEGDDIQITTNNFSLSNLATVSADNAGEGNTGNITINATNLTLANKVNRI